MKKIPVKRFIAGAVCPSCSEMDKIVVYKEDDGEIRECISCGFKDAIHFNQQVRELETRVNKTKEQKLAEVQILDFPVKRATKKTAKQEIKPKTKAEKNEKETPVSNVTPIEPKIRPEKVINDSDVINLISCELVNHPGATQTQKVAHFYKTIYTLRRTKDFDNCDLAAVEHYLYARFLVGVTGDPMVETSPMTIHIKKRVFALLKLQEIAIETVQKGEEKKEVELNTQPVEDKQEETPVLTQPGRAHLFKWEQDGAREGMKDWECANSGKTKNPGAALRILMNPTTKF